MVPVDWAGRRAFQDVLTSARAGDDAAFAELWRWLHPPLVRWLGVIAYGDVEDIESEVWLSVTRSLGSFTGDASDFRGWLFALARRRAIDWGRRRRRQPSTSALDSVEIAERGELPSMHDDTEAALAMLRRLTVEQREVVALRVIVGMSVRETAAVVHRSEGAVRILCHRGLRALARHLDADALADEVVP